jgi:hypothetical protein
MSSPVPFYRTGCQRAVPEMRVETYVVQFFLQPGISRDANALGKHKQLRHTTTVIYFSK